MSISRRLATIALLLMCVQVAAQQFNPNLYSEMRWRMIGPYRGGRTVAAVGIPGQPNVFYIGVNNGGVWRTTDFGHTWQPLFDSQPTQSIGALAIAPSNPKIIYAGSGEGLQRPDLSIGDGIYKSTDGGETWQHLGLRDGQQIPAIIVDPKDPNRVFAAVLGHPYGPNSERGVYRSTDGGQNWQRVLYKDPNTGAIDLAFDPRNPQTIYAVLWAARRPPWSVGNSYNGPGSGLFKSTDGGNSWLQINKGLPTFEQGLGRIGLGVSPSDPNRIYAMVDAKPELGGLYRSDDAGMSWRKVNNESRIWGRGSDFAEVKVDPRNPDVIYVANISTYRSTDGGQNFTAIKGAPGGDDYHRIWINPENPNIILIAADQGATITVNGGRTWSSWYNQPTGQMYHVTTDNRFPYWVCSGQQESGSACVASRGDSGAITVKDWRTVGTEEYGYVAPDPLNPNTSYGGKVTRYDWTTTQTQDVSPVVLMTGQYRFNRTAPLIFSPVDKHALYLGSSVLFKTTDGGNSWQIISPDLTRPDNAPPPTLGNFVSADPQKGKHGGVIYSIGPSFKDADQIWIGTDDGLIQMTRDGGKTWQNVTPMEMTQWSKVAQIEASHFDTETCYAAVNRLRVDDLKPYIYRTHDGGRSWLMVSNGIPDNEPVNAVREDPVRKGLLFAATERSVYVSFDDGDNWQSLRLNLPATSIRDLVIHDDDVVVGTHGRSFWILDNITPLRQLTAQVAQSRAHLFQPQTAIRVRRSTNTDTPLPPEEPVGQNPPAGAIIDYYLTASSGPVTLEIANSTGKVVRRFSSDDKPAPPNPKELNIPMYWVRMPRVLSAAPGMHRWVWDLHYDAPNSLSHEYPISAVPYDTPREPLGPRALPGQYTVKLTVGGQSFTQPLTLKMDPRVSTTESGIADLFALQMKLADAMNRSYAALQQARGLQQQIQAVQQRANAQLAPAVKAFADRVATFTVGGAGGQFSGWGGESFSQLNASLGRVYQLVDAADAAPTTQATATANQLQQMLERQLAAWEQLKSRDLVTMNQQLRRAGFPALQPTPASSPPPEE